MNQGRRTFLKASLTTGLAMALAKRLGAQEDVPDNVNKDPRRQIQQRKATGDFDFTKQFEVVVAGAGMAGIAAALAAARSGRKVGLIEKTIQPGGLATIGLESRFTPLDDGRGNLVTTGIAEELLLASQKFGAGRVASDWKSGKERYEAEFNSLSFIFALDELLEAAGVTVIYDMWACDPVFCDGKMTGLEVENTMGRGLMEGKCFVDATGSGEVAFRAGAPVVEHENDVALSLLVSKKKGKKVIVESLPRDLMPSQKLWGTGRDLSRYALETRKAMGAYCLREKETTSIGFMPAMPQMSLLRTVTGTETFSLDAIGKKSATTVGWVADPRSPGRVWPIPYGALLPKGGKGLLMAGRCASASDRTAGEILGLISTRALTGQIAGHAAAMAARDGLAPDALEIGKLRSELSKIGVRV